MYTQSVTTGMFLSRKPISSIPATSRGGEGVSHRYRCLLNSPDFCWRQTHTHSRTDSNKKTSKSTFNYIKNTQKSQSTLLLRTQPRIMENSALMLRLDVWRSCCCSWLAFIFQSHLFISRLLKVRLILKFNSTWLRDWSSCFFLLLFLSIICKL